MLRVYVQYVTVAEQHINVNEVARLFGTAIYQQLNFKPHKNYDAALSALRFFISDFFFFI